MRHQPVEMERKKPYAIYTAYIGRGWKANFECPNCQRKTWQHMNYLGNKRLFCNGDKLSKWPALEE